MLMRVVMRVSSPALRAEREGRQIAGRVVRGSRAESYALTPGRRMIINEAVRLRSELMVHGG